MRMSVSLREEKRWNSVTPLEINGITYMVDQVQYVLIKSESNRKTRSPGLETGGVTGLSNSRCVIYIVGTLIDVS